MNEYLKEQIENRKNVERSKKENDIELKRILIKNLENQEEIQNIKNKNYKEKLVDNSKFVMDQ